jgi:hypothetical protein
MRGRSYYLLIALVCLATAFVASPAVAGSEESGAVLEVACSATWTCPVGSDQTQVSCTGTQHCEAAPNYVTCDGVTTVCTTTTLPCIILCGREFRACIVRCPLTPDPVQDPCGCAAEHDLCLAQCD